MSNIEQKSEQKGMAVFFAGRLSSEQESAMHWKQWQVRRRQEEAAAAAVSSNETKRIMPLFHYK